MVSVPGHDARRVDFDYLILATGADYRRPITPTAAEPTLASRGATWEREAARVRAARSVLVLGGGAVGTELAAEIACYFPEKRVTLVNGNSHLVPLFPQKTVDYVERWFASRSGCELILGEKLVEWDDRSCTTATGRVIEADLVFVCFGLSCNSQSLSGGDMADCLSERREVRVNEYFQVEGRPNVFAVGDVMVNPAREIKQAYYAEMNGTAAAHNVIRHAKGEPMLKYPDDVAGASLMPLVYVVSLGRYKGSLGFNSLVLNGLLGAIMKWIIEWTKVKAMAGRPIGLFIWEVGDAVTFFLSRRCIKPRRR
mmetsp:Transcript_118559/g.369301  ORF Transcript_118559/g.369301 Transcript_118559/m.369301 type:complete len:311 (-) Transcript_118559:50-982(-)